MGKPLAIVTGASSDGDVFSGWQNKARSAIAAVTTAGILAEQHRTMAQPDSAKTGR
jgi:hypothetical protein